MRCTTVITCGAADWRSTTTDAGLGGVVVAGLWPAVHEDRQERTTVTDNHSFVNFSIAKANMLDLPRYVTALNYQTPLADARVGIND